MIIDQQIHRQSRVYRADLEANPNALYIFGDNTERQGLGGQAGEMRGESNAHGIATCQGPGLPFSDETYSQNCQVIMDDMIALTERMDSGGYTLVVFPLDGIGTGIANIAEAAPRTSKFLNHVLETYLGV
jgi:hypothetical protein